MRVLRTLSSALEETGDTEICRRTMEYIFEYLHHNCYLLKSNNGSLELMELYPVPKNKYAKECALIAVDEVLNDLKESLEIAEDFHPHAKGILAGSLLAWQKVKIEIEKQ
jgi:hypothetical protein